jgi:hypothetical protein
MTAGLRLLRGIFASSFKRTGRQQAECSSEAHFEQATSRGTHQIQLQIAFTGLLMIGGESY